jgi:hypothetical protein
MIASIGAQYVSLVVQCDGERLATELRSELEASPVVGLQIEFAAKDVNRRVAPGRLARVWLDCSAVL